MKIADKPFQKQQQLHDHACIEISANLLQSYFDDKKSAKESQVRAILLQIGIGITSVVCVISSWQASVAEGEMLTGLEKSYSKLEKQMKAAGIGAKTGNDLDPSVLAAPAKFKDINSQVLNDLGSVFMSTEAGAIQLQTLSIDVSEAGQIKLIGSAEVNDIRLGRTLTERITQLRPDREAMITSVKVSSTSPGVAGLLNLDFQVTAPAPIQTGPQSMGGPGVQGEIKK